MGRIIIVNEDRAIDMAIVKAHEDGDTSFRAYEESSLLHCCEVFAGGIDGRPDRDHQLDTEFFQFMYHCCGVRPAFGVEPPISLRCPMEIVDDNDRQWKPTPFVLACH